MEMEQEEDIEIMLAENPPEPEEMPENMGEQVRRVKIVAEEEIRLGTEQVGGVMVEAPRAKVVADQRPRDLKKNELFDGYEQLYEEKKEKKDDFELNIPDMQQEVDEEEEKRKNDIISELEKKVPKNKMQLWEFNIDWEKLSKSVVLERYIRPWLEDMSNLYMGGVEEKFIALV